MKKIWVLILLFIFCPSAHSQEIFPISTLESLAAPLKIHWVPSYLEWQHQLPRIQTLSEQETGQPWGIEEAKHWLRIQTGLNLCFENECWIYWDRETAIQQLKQAQSRLLFKADQYEKMTSIGTLNKRLPELYRQEAQALPYLQQSIFLTTTQGSWAPWHESAHALLHAWAMDASQDTQTKEFLADLIGWTLANRSGAHLSLTSLIHMRQQTQQANQQLTLRYKKAGITPLAYEDLSSHDTAVLLQRFVAEHPSFIAQATEETIALRAIHWIHSRNPP